jgi:antitoxin component of MazEF toxin-antitoxin module
METEHTPIVEKRRLVASGSSVMLVVPKQWLEENGLDKGDDILMVANGDLTFKKMTKENVDKIRNQLSYHNQTSSVATDRENPAGS